jgi:hypothetical protein
MPYSAPNTPTKKLQRRMWRAADAYTRLQLKAILRRRGKKLNASEAERISVSRCVAATRSGTAGTIGQNGCSLPTGYELAEWLLIAKRLKLNGICMWERGDRLRVNEAANELLRNERWKELASLLYTLEALGEPLPLTLFEKDVRQKLIAHLRQLR